MSLAKAFRQRGIDLAGLLASLGWSKEPSEAAVRFAEGLDGAAGLLEALGSRLSLPS